MTTSRNNTIMSWMAYTDFLSRLRIAAGILLPLNTRTLLLYPGGRDCIGAAGVDAYSFSLARRTLAAEHMTRQPRVSYAAAFDAYCPNMTVTERFTTFRYARLMAAASYDACPPRPFGRGGIL